MVMQVVVGIVQKTIQQQALIKITGAIMDAGPPRHDGKIGVRCAVGPVDTGGVTQHGGSTGIGQAAGALTVETADQQDGAARHLRHLMVRRFDPCLPCDGEAGGFHPLMVKRIVTGPHLGDPGLAPNPDTGP